MSTLLGLARRGEYPECVESELDGIVVPLQVFFNKLNASVSSLGSTGVVFSAPVYQKMPVTANTTITRQLLVAESGLVVTNAGATGDTTIVLPSASAGLMFTLAITDAQTLTIQAAAGDTIRIAGYVTSAGGTFAESDIGNSVTLVAMDHATWMATASCGTWDTVT